MVKQNICRLNHCYGCGVCVKVCPQKIISLEENRDGFYSPIIKDENKCTECGLCYNVCSFCDEQHTLGSSKYQIRGFAGWSNNIAVRQRCSTGGVLFEIACHLLKEGFEACGVRYDVAHVRAEHFIAKSPEEFVPSIGSKYLQSYTTDAFLQLARKKKYVVVGTPCQIASLRKYIKLVKIEDNFILIDFFCHGVPSANMWRKYLKEVLSQTNTIPEKIDWRNKANGWHDSWVMSFKNKPNASYYYTSNLHDGDLFYNMFLCNHCLNKCCYDDCKFKKESSSADIRVGDLWGSHYEDNQAGVNGILALTETGLSVLKSVPTISLVEQPLDIVMEGQMERGPKRDFIAKLDCFLLKTSLSLPTIAKINRLVPQVMRPFAMLKYKASQYFKLKK